MGDLTFSGSAADFLKAMGRTEIPETKPQSGLKESIAAKKKMEAEKSCADPHCTEDHSHAHHAHSHGHGETCTEDHSHGGHAHAGHGHDKEHDHGGHGHGHGHGHDNEHAHGGHKHAEKSHQEAGSAPKCGEPGCCPESSGHAHGHGHAEKAHAEGDHAHGGHAHAHGGHANGGDGHAHGHGHAAHAAEHPIAAKLRAALGAEHVEVIAEGDGCGAKLQITVVSAQFEGKPLLAQHRLVNDAAADDLKQVHAFNIKTFTPTKWAQAKQH